MHQLKYHEYNYNFVQTERRVGVENGQGHWTGVRQTAGAPGAFCYHFKEKTGERFRDTQNRQRQNHAGWYLCKCLENIKKRFLVMFLFC